MQERLTAAEAAIVKLSEGQVKAFAINGQIAKSVEKIATSLDQLNRFQTETEVHRLHDMEFKKDMGDKITLLMNHRENDLDSIFKEIRNENSKLSSIHEAQTVLKNDMDNLTEDFKNHIEKEEKTKDRKVTIWLSITVVIIGSLFTWWLNK